MAKITADMFEENTPALEEMSILPKGQFLFEVESAEAHPTKDGNAQKIWAKCKIVGGEHDGRKGVDFWNLPGPGLSGGQQEFSKKFWKRVAEVCPRAVVKTGVDPDLLKGLQFKALVTHQEYPEASGKFNARFQQYAFVKPTAAPVPAAGGGQMAG